MRSVDHSIFGSKKGQWIQLIFSVVFLLVLGIVFLSLTKVTGSLNDQIQASDSLDNSSKSSMQAHTSATPNVFDSSIAIILALIWLLCLALAYNSAGSPMLLAISLIIIVGLGFVGMILSNTWDSVAGSQDFSSTRQELAITGFFLDNYLAVVLVMAFSTVIVAMSRGGGF